MAKKPVVFISHIKEEEEVAAAFESLVIETFRNTMEPFRSSIPMGSQWLQKIEKGLRECSIAIVIASPTSVTRPWINFEAGAVWIRDKDIIPLCHSGMKPADLPEPLKARQAAVATEERELKLLFQVLAKELGFDLKNDDVNFGPFIAAVTEFERVSKESKALTTAAGTPQVDGLPFNELITLVTIGESVGPNEGLSVSYLIDKKAKDAGITGLAASLGVKMLQRKGLVEFQKDSDDFGNRFDSVMITDDGWDWLNHNRDMLNLKAADGGNATKTRTGATEPQSDEIPF